MTTPRRLAALGLVGLFGLAAPARGNDFLRGLCGHKGCADTQRVVIPGHQVEVVREQPRVVVREVAPAREMVSRTVHRSADVGVVPINTVYLPLTMPVFPAVPAFPAAPAAREICPPHQDRDLEGDSNPFAAIHRAELAAYKSDRAQREVQALADLHRGAADRMLRGGVGGRAPEATRAPEAAAIESRLAKLETEMARMNERLTAVERLLLYHDNYLTQHAGARPGGAGVGTTGTTGGTAGGTGGTGGGTTTVPMIPPAGGGPGLPLPPPPGAGGVVPMIPPVPSGR